MSDAQMANEAIYHMISQAGSRPMVGEGEGGRPGGGGGEVGGGQTVGLSFQNGLIKILVAVFVVRSNN